MTGLPRHLMPQIPKNKIKEFRQYLDKQGIESAIVRKPLDWFTPVQKHVNQEKVNNLVENPKKVVDAPLIATTDGFLVDGHHRWIAAKKLGLNELVTVVCECDLREFLKKAHDFDHSYVKSVHELTTYGRLALLSESMDNKALLVRKAIRAEIRSILSRLPHHKVMELREKYAKGPNGPADAGMTYSNGSGNRMKYDDSTDSYVPNTGG